MDEGALHPGLGGVDLSAARGAQVGDGNLQFNVFAGRQPAAVRSTYLEQVRRIAPPETPGLVGREKELSELTAFCLDSHSDPYVWWQAGPWAGKSALLSTFVLRPPAAVREGVRIVSFFVTARLAAQDTREAFTQAILEQLAELTGQELPAVLPEATREGFLMDLLARAAHACQESGGRLVLLVDGLDEDCGVTVGPHAHSIASLLPVDPPCGMRVIVAGRPSPPIPDDVPDWHPLRNPGIVRMLEDSPYARDLQRLGRQELQRLLHGTPLEQDLLGLLTAARGGLSRPDLEELSSASTGEVEEVLHTVAGRTFTCRVARQGGPGPGSEIYLLGHEELRFVAARHLGRRLHGYHERLHQWADVYRLQGWPTGTPEYLLNSYYRLLVTLDDIPRMIACAADADRHDLLLRFTGGDGTALAEIRAALDAIIAEPAPDVASAVVLACHRDLLTERNANIPPRLPAVWAALGQVTRAEALAASIPGAAWQAEALYQIAAVLTLTGEYGQAEEVAASIADSARQVSALASVAEALANTGQQEEARRVAGRVQWYAGNLFEPVQHVQALARAAEVLARPDALEDALAAAHQAEALANTITSRAQQAEALAWAAGALARAGERGKAEQVASHAKDLVVGSSLRADVGTDVLMRVAETLAKAGFHQPAEEIADAFAGPSLRAETLGLVAAALARAGEPEEALRVALRAEESALSVYNLRQWSPNGGELSAEPLAPVALALAAAGNPGEAVRLARRAQDLASTIYDQLQRAAALVGVAEAFAAGEELERAAEVLRLAEANLLAFSFGFPSGDSRLAHVQSRIAVLQARGASPEDAHSTARNISEPIQKAGALVQVAGALAEAGLHDLAEAVATSIRDPGWQADALMEVAAALAWAGAKTEGARLAEQAEAAARSITNPDRQADALATIAAALAKAGRSAQAEAVLDAIHDPAWQGDALVRVAGALAEAGDYERAQAIAADIPNPAWRVLALSRIARALARAGDQERAASLARLADAAGRSSSRAARTTTHLIWGATAAEHEPRRNDQAEVAARSIPDPERRTVALIQVAEAFGVMGNHQRAVSAAENAKAAADEIQDQAWRSEAFARVGGVLVGLKQYDRAEEVASSIPEPALRGAALARVAQAFGSSAKPEEAERVARQAELAIEGIADSNERTQSLTWLVGALAEAGLHERAETIAASIRNSGLRAEALVRMAESLARGGDTPSARRLTAAACAAGTWTESIAPALLVEPSAFAALSHALERRWHLRLLAGPATTDGC